MKIRGCFSLTAAIAVSAFGQNDRVLSLGVKGGIPVTEAFSSEATGSPGCGTTAEFIPCSETGYASGTKHLLVGPSVEVRLGRGFAVEADALYHRLSYDSWTIYQTPSGGLHYYYSSAAANDWEFPLLVK